MNPWTASCAEAGGGPGRCSIEDIRADLISGGCDPATLDAQVGAIASRLQATMAGLRRRQLAAGDKASPVPEGDGIADE